MSFNGLAYQTYRPHKLNYKYFLLLFLIFLVSGTSSLVLAQDNTNLPFAPNDISCVTFQQQAPGTLVEGLGTVHPNLNISGAGTIVAIAEGVEPKLYSGPNYPGFVTNVGTAEFGGFSDVDQIHDYSFAFTPGMAVSYFSINMLDYGDFNPIGATEHNVSLVGYDANGFEVARDTLTFTSDGNMTPDDELWNTGDATTAVGNPGNYIFTVSGASMSRIELEFSTNLGVGPSDTKFGFSILCFEPEAPPPQPPAGSMCADFNLLEPGTSAEGLGTVHPNLNISGAGNVVAIAEGQEPKLYTGPNIPGNLVNYGSGDYGGISDSEQIHDYNFSFAPGVTVDYFSINMLDFGDYNPNGATEHNASLVAYDSAGNVVATDTLSFTSDGVLVKGQGLWITGDASAAVGQPGNYYFVVAGTGIASLELQFSSNLGDGPSDTKFGFSVLCFQPEGGDPPTPPAGTSCADFNLLEPGTLAEGLGAVHPNLNISGAGTIVAIAEGVEPKLYSGPNYPGFITNVGTAEFGGFSDVAQIHDYAFSFSPGMAVSYFSINMLDYGDFNPIGATEHNVALVGYDKFGFEVARDTLSFTSDGNMTPDDELWNTGDATTAVGNPGNYIFTVSGASMSRIELEFSTNLGVGPSDTKFGFSILCFEPEAPPPQPPAGSMCADFNLLEPGTSAEGLGTVHPNLNISGAGNVVAIAEGQEPKLYTGPNIPGNLVNYGSGDYGGISDSEQIHDYNFSFAPGVTVDYFSINMLDFGDYNPNGATEHNASLVAYDSAGNVVATDTLSFTSDGVLVKGQGLWITGDASAAVGQPGNYYFVVAGTGIASLELQFSSNLGDGPSDTKFGFSVLCFQPETEKEPELDPPTAVLELLRPKTNEVGGKFLVEYACSETAPNLVSATINGYDVTSGQNVNLVVRSNESARIVNNVLIWLFAPEFSLDVTCADANGNEVSTSVVPNFGTP